MRIRPFRAFRFDSAVVGDVGGCIAPPYDVISPAQQQQLYDRNRYNIVRVIKGKTAESDDGSNNQYTRAAEYLNNWIEQNALKQDLAEAIYAYVQDFELSGTMFQRLTFIALAGLEEFGKIVKPHEQILNGPMVDRLNLKKATSAEFGLVFMVYDDPEKIADKIILEAATQEPLIDYVDEQDVRHRVFTITAKKNIDAIMKMMSDKSCIIADGHHRYTTGLSYSKQNNNPSAKYQMLAFANTYQEGLKILATHRVVGNIEDFCFERLIKDLEENFEITKLQFNSAQTKAEAKQKMLEQMKAAQDNGTSAFGIYGSNNSFYVAVLKNKNAMDAIVPNMSLSWRTLDVSVLQKLILEKLLGINEQRLAKGENVQYVKDTPNAIDESIAQIDEGQKQAAFFMNSVTIQQLKKVTDAGERMPQKSTYFYPKVYTGLTINKW